MRIWLWLIAMAMSACIQEQPSDPELGRYCKGDLCSAGLSCVAMADNRSCVAPGQGDPLYRECDAFFCTRSCASEADTGKPCSDDDGAEGYCDVVKADNGHGEMAWLPFCMPSCDATRTEADCPAGLYPHERDFGGCTCLPFVGG